jgi:hypothetical protein
MSAIDPALKVSVKVGDKAYACAATDTTKCDFAR